MALANATVDSQKEVMTHDSWGYSREFNLSALTAGLTATVPHSGPTGTAADFVEFYATTAPTDGSVVTMLSATTDTTNNELDLTFTVPAGGSLDGAVLRVLGHWRAAAGQDGESINTDTDD